MTADALQQEEVGNFGISNLRIRSLTEAVRVAKASVNRVEGLRTDLRIAQSPLESQKGRVEHAQLQETAEAVKPQR